MKQISFLLLGCLIFGAISAQNQSVKNNSVIITGGYISFGTGDFLGYAVNTEFQRKFAKHFSWSTEINVESGNKFPDLQEGFQSIIQVSNIAVSPKLNYYPFNKIIPGFNLSVAPTIGYQSLLHESKWTIYRDTNGTVVGRTSVLDPEEKIFIGYRISFNYHFNIGNSMILGLRTDFSNYNNGDINTMLALKAGIKF
jgi:hypothetical protein